LIAALPATASVQIGPEEASNTFEWGPNQRIQRRRNDFIVAM